MVLWFIYRYSLIFNYIISDKYTLIKFRTIRFSHIVINRQEFDISNAVKVVVVIDLASDTHNIRYGGIDLVEVSDKINIFETYGIGERSDSTYLVDIGKYIAKELNLLLEIWRSTNQHIHSKETLNVKGQFN